ncbi:MAG: putative membrane protein [Candidatus Promineifilaceae bacterium]|jgi:hypothetical protein
MTDASSRAKPSRLPILLSAVFPGLGQCMQKRWAAGCFYGLTTLVALVMFVVEVVRIIVLYYRLMFESLPEAPSAVPLLIWFGVTLTLFLVSLWDTQRALRLQARVHAQDRVQEIIKDASTDDECQPPPVPSREA